MAYHFEQLFIFLPIPVIWEITGEITLWPGHTKDVNLDSSIILPQASRQVLDISIILFFPLLKLVFSRSIDMEENVLGL
jgi:hypothetical protein